MLIGRRIAILVEDGYEDSEVTVPLKSMKAANARVIIVGTDFGKSYRSKSGKRMILADIAVNRAKAEDFDAIIIPGGYAPDRMRLNQSMIDLVKKAHGLGRIVAAICEGPLIFISADIARGQQLTSLPSMALDFVNAGADWVNEPVVQYGNIITSRKPVDLPMFNKAIIDAVIKKSHSLEIG